MQVSVSVEGSLLELGPPRELFRGDFTLGFYLEGGAWDVSADGKKFAMLRDCDDQISLDTDDELR